MLLNKSVGHISLSITLIFILLVDIFPLAALCLSPTTINYI